MTCLVARGHDVTATDHVDPIDVHRRSNDRDAVIVVSALLPDAGMRIVQYLTAVEPRLALVVIDDSVSVARAVDALRFGARAVIGAQTTLETAERILVAAVAGDSVVPSSLLQRDSPSKGHGLSHREIHVLQLVVDGMEIAQIATRLYISDRTVKHHLSSAYAKLGAHTRTEAVVRALRSGVVTLDGS